MATNQFAFDLERDDLRPWRGLPAYLETTSIGRRSRVTCDTWATKGLRGVVMPRATVGHRYYYSPAAVSWFLAQLAERMTTKARLAA